MESDYDGPMDIRSYPLESNKYSAHSLSFVTSGNAPKAREPSATIIRALNKGNEKALRALNGHSESRPVSYVSHTDSSAWKRFTFSSNKERTSIQPPPEAYLQAPYRGTRQRSETPSLLTQATNVSASSYTQAVITHARKDPVASATARTITVDNMPPSRTPSPVDTVMPHEQNPSIDLGTRAPFFPATGGYGKI
jgi:hypothetical protein